MTKLNALGVISFQRKKKKDFVDDYKKQNLTFVENWRAKFQMVFHMVSLWIFNTGGSH